MAHSHKFAVIKFSPDNFREECLNIGIVVIDNDDIRLHLTPRLDKVRALSGAVELHYLIATVNAIKAADEINRRSSTTDIKSRFEMLRKLGPLKLSNMGSFVTSSLEDYEFRVNAIMQQFVEPEPTIRVERAKRTRLVSAIKRALKEKSILATTKEDLDSHRVVTNYNIDNGIRADFLLKNGKYHVVETVDIHESQDLQKKYFSDIAVSALTLERARMVFGKEKTSSRLIYNAGSATESIISASLQAVQNQGVELYNWQSHDDQLKFISNIERYAIPTPNKVKQGITSVTARGGVFH